MANFCGTGRSNFFKVKNEEVFREFFPCSLRETTDASDEAQFMIRGHDESGDFGLPFYMDPVACIEVKSNIFNGTIYPEHEEGALETNIEAEKHLRDKFSAFKGYDSSSSSFLVTDRFADGSDIELDASDIIADYLVDGEVAVFFASGNEKLRYITGFAEAVNSEGKSTFISLDHIDEKIEKTMGNPKGSYSMPMYQETVTREQSQAVRNKRCLTVAPSAEDTLEKSKDVKFVEGGYVCHVFERDSDGDYEINIYDLQGLSFDDENEALDGGTFDSSGGAKKAIRFTKDMCEQLNMTTAALAKKENSSTMEP